MSVGHKVIAIGKIVVVLSRGRCPNKPQQGGWWEPPWLRHVDKPNDWLSSRHTRSHIIFTTTKKRKHHPWVIGRTTEARRGGKKRKWRQSWPRILEGQDASLARQVWIQTLALPNISFFILRNIMFLKWKWLAQGHIAKAELSWKLVPPASGYCVPSPVIVLV